MVSTFICVHTILLRPTKSFKMGLPLAYGGVAQGIHDWMVTPSRCRTRHIPGRCRPRNPHSYQA